MKLLFEFVWFLFILNDLSILENNKKLIKSLRYDFKIIFNMLIFLLFDCWLMNKFDDFDNKDMIENIPNIMWPI